MDYKPTIGLEVHAELKTKTKMFCSCKNDTEEKRPNVNVCPVCMGHPGTLPVINKEAVKHVLKIGLAVGGKLADLSEFDRKNYFYPDIPKGYQISQYKYPLVSGGEIGGVSLTRIHLEEDTAKSSHEQGDYSLVDFNRAGVPLMELVTMPVIHSASEVVVFGEELQKLLQYLGVSSANMEKGEMRLEANVSISKEEKLGTKVEIKNLNSFRAAERAILYEIARQAEVLDGGGKVAQETRGWDEKKQSTFSQRSKEDSHDYRYFPDPDLPKLHISKIPDFDLEKLKSELGETPDQKRSRFKDSYGLKESDIEFYVSNLPMSKFFEATVLSLSDAKNAQILSNYIVSDVAGMGEKGLNLKPEHVARVIEMIFLSQVSSRGAKDILLNMADSGKDPDLIAKENDLFQKSNEGELLSLVKKIIEENQSVVSEYKRGKLSSLQFLIGQGMKASKGSANPQVLKDLFEKNL
jgi:aspartyl-tRNA(Asn)/glutamyl-tRNA(Gln) amidotransferase subunit B